jgi:hypothetical protein
VSSETFLQEKAVEATKQKEEIKEEKTKNPLLVSNIE